MKRKSKKQKKPDDLSELVDFISRRFDEMEVRFDKLENMSINLQGAVDNYAKRADAYFQEMVMLSHQVSRHEKWIREIAGKIGLKLRD